MTGYVRHILNVHFHTPLPLPLISSAFERLFHPENCLTLPGALVGGSRAFIDMISLEKSNLYGGNLAI